MGVEKIRNRADIFNNLFFGGGSIFENYSGQLEVGMFCDGKVDCRGDGVKKTHFVFVFSRSDNGWTSGLYFKVV